LHECLNLDAPLNEIFMKFAPKPLFLPLIVLVATVFQPPIAQANPSQWVKRSDAAVKMLRSFHDRFSCAPQMAEQRIGFTRYEVASAVSACSDLVNEIIATATSDSLSQSDLKNLQQLQSTFSLEIDQIKAPVHPSNMAELARQGFSLNTGLRSTPVFALDPVVTTTQLEALERNQFSRTTKSEATVVFPENSSNPKSIAQANQSPLVKRLDAIFKQWESVQDKFGCNYLPRRPLGQPDFTRYEMAAAINACYDRLGEFVTGINLAGTNGAPAASPEDLKMLEPFVTEFAAEIATLRGPVTGPVTYPSPVLNTGRLIVVYTESGRTIVPYEQFAWRYPSAEYIGPDYDPNAPPRKPAPRSIDAWIIPTLKEFQSRYDCFNDQIQITDPSDLIRSRYEVATIIDACAKGYYKRGIKLRKTDATDFLGMQQAFAEELMTLQEKHREAQRQKCLVNRCE
jgi:hypothetical protein